MECSFRNICPFVSPSWITPSMERQNNFLTNLESGIQFPDYTDRNFQWELRKVRDLTGSDESGVSTQIKVILSNDNKQILGRLKETNFNEAIMYHRIQNSRDPDPLGKYTPRFLGALDCNGNAIDLDKITEQEIGSLISSNEHAYIILEDLLENLEESVKVAGEVQDLKFVKPPLLGNLPINPLVKILRQKMLTGSGCAFAHRRSIKGNWFIWFINIIRSVLSIASTKKTLQNNFKRMDVVELAHNMRRLNTFKEAITASKFTAADASLLFIPTTYVKNGREVNDISIRLIDFGYGIRSEENVANFDQMKQSMADSIQELIELMRAVYLEKIQPAR